MSKGTIVITGASSGLGEEMARQFADLGYDLGLAARRTDRLEALASEITGKHPDRRVELKALDVNDDEAVFRVFKEFAADFGTLDRVVVNAGLGKGAPLGTGRYDANRQTAMVNFVGALAQMEAAMEIFREQRRGHLVVISSVTAMRGMRKTITTYAGTKAGVASLAEGVRLECKLAQGRHGQGQLPRDFWPTYSAFANTQGGVVLLGVREHNGRFSVAGIPEPERLLRELLDGLENPARVSVNLLGEDDLQLVRIDGKTLLRVRIPEAPAALKPVYLNGDVLNNTYRRVDSSDMRLTPDEVRTWLAATTTH